MSRLRNIFAAVAFLIAAAPAQAACTDDEFMDPINDVVWDCIFPITIASIPLDFGNHPPDNEAGGLLCECPGQGIYGIGFLVTFWEPARVVETVADPWCFPTMGMELDGGSNLGYEGSGTLYRDAGLNSNIAYQNYHYYITPMWAILDLFTDIPCISDEPSFDLAMVSEIRPDWHDDLTAAQYYPRNLAHGVRPGRNGLHGRRDSGGLSAPDRRAVLVHGELGNHLPHVGGI